MPHPIDINLRRGPTFRRGEGGRVDVGRAFRLCWRMTLGMQEGEMVRRPQQGDHKGTPLLIY